MSTEKQMTPLREVIKIIDDAIARYKLERDEELYERQINILAALKRDTLKLLPKEKQMVIDAYTDAACDYGGDGQDSEEYFNEKYTQ